jgi:hypothetical protein
MTTGNRVIGLLNLRGLLDNIFVKHTISGCPKRQKSRFFEASHFSAQSWDADFLDSLTIFF